MAKFRFHRRTLEESLSTEVTAIDRNDLRKVIEIEYRSIFETLSAELEIQYYAHDKRVSTDLYAVSVGGIPVGFLYFD